MKDTLEKAREPNLNLKGFLQTAYVHPVFKGGDDSDSDSATDEIAEEPALVPTKRHSRRSTPLPSKHSGSLSQVAFPDASCEFWLYIEVVMKVSELTVGYVNIIEQVQIRYIDKQNEEKRKVWPEVIHQ